MLVKGDMRGERAASVVAGGVSARIQAKANYRRLVMRAGELDERAGTPGLRVQEVLRELCKRDLFYLLVYVCGRKDLDSDFHFARCREVMEDNDGVLDLWARGHGKSSIITFGKTIQDILNDPEVTCSIFSHTKPIARAFLRQIKYELETNERLKALFPDVLYSDPKKESPRWSEEKGIVVKRKSNPKEATLEAHGLVDGQPTSRHFGLMVYDDVVTLESVSTPEMIEKVTDAWRLSLNLAAEESIQRYIGTRYHFADTYDKMMKQGSVRPRIYPATVDGTIDGEPVWMTREQLRKKLRDMGSFVFSAQMLQNPLAGGDRSFKDEWLEYYSDVDASQMNIYIVVDPANSKKKDSDYTVMWVIGLGSDKNYYLLDGVRDRLNLAERSRKLFELHRQWKPIRVGYEQYALMSDVFYIKEKMVDESYRFSIIELGGRTSKSDRIEGLVPLFENHRIWLPERLYYVDSTGMRVDLVKAFLEEEYRCWPVPHHDDMLDCMARIKDADLGTKFPKGRMRTSDTESRLQEILMRQGMDGFYSGIGSTQGGMAA